MIESAPLPSSDRPDTSGSRPRRVLIIANPVAGRRRPGRLPAIVQHIQTLGCAVTVRQTERAGDGLVKARQALAENFDVIVAAGGDGTINEVLSGLAGSRQVMAIIPMGTANALAAEIGLGSDECTVAEVIVRGRATPIYYGRANDRTFVMMAGIGLDAHVVAGVNLWLKRRVGKLAYVIEALAQIIRYRPLVYRVVVDGVEYRAASVIVANGHFYGGRFVCAPQARLQDPTLHVCLLERPGRWNAMRYVLALAGGWLCRLPDCRIIPAQRVSIDGPVGEPVQVDGDATTCLPLTLTLAEERLNFILPGGAL